MLTQVVQATLTRCREGQALVILNGGPFNGLEIRPGQLRDMALALEVIASAAVKFPTGGKHWRPMQLQLGPSAPSELKS